MNDYLRYRILTDIVSKMSDDEKAYFANREVLNALSRQEEQIGDLSRKIGRHPFASDLLANVAGNYITEGISWVVRTLIKKI